VHEAVVSQAAAHPDLPAVVFGASVLTYGKLIENAYSVACQLRAAGVHPEIAVASCLPRGLAWRRRFWVPGWLAEL
jgi:non-ribosomal peptide synthetase component F